jgi:NADPH-dependent 2,4-dienoyl-CoA reductase/sulfur reductase-like enzyme
LEGALGGFAGALAALRLGKSVIITEETDWIGGQITAQAVPPDEQVVLQKILSSSKLRV